MDQLHTALEQAQRAGHQGSAELVASLQAELERQAGVIGELRAQLRVSSDAQEELRRQAVSLVEAQAHMAAEQRDVVDGPPVVVAMLHAQLLEKVSYTSLPWFEHLNLKHKLRVVLQQCYIHLSECILLHCGGILLA